ncbi:1-phosphatidylinositol 4-kinase [Heracleum sosnowskyi]|uniref:1-phosphatidylinositol 4-kinase n=1 Tax=Heracleum sosnowskyi TaxID=360622 RepID=A0AAD8MVU1_9APIA|nr:1-phosphatidylinositol 4-kinase [Heracleum sosnowskyi]
MKIFKMAVTINQQHHELQSFVRPPKCKLQSYSNFDQIMLDFAQSNLSHSFKHAFELTNLHRSSSSPCLSRTREDSDANANPRVEIVGGHGAPKVLALVVEVAIAMASGFDIEPVSSGLGGAYIVHARNGVNIAVVKPIDEEPLAFNNPKGFAGRMLGQPGLKHSIRVGETGIRELAAYLIDHDGFAGVPPTALVKTSHVTFHVNNSETAKTVPPCKIASLQRFVAHDSDAGDLGPSGFSVSSVHRIGILDVRILNLDRHSGNLLVRHGQEGYAVGAAELVPIDHGLCLPETLDDPYFEWLHWPQASIPFSEHELEYISDLDPFKDAEILRTKVPFMRESSLRVLVICTIFLKRATAAGFCLAEIGEMMTREFRGGKESTSVLENLCQTAKAGLSGTKSDDDSDYGNENTKLFQFNSECEDDSNQVSYIPQLLETTNRAGKPPKIPKYSYERLISKFHNLMLPLQDEECQSKRAEAYNNSLRDSSDHNSGMEIDQNAGGISRSTSFSVHNHNHDSEGISFGEMNKEEWELFLESFVELLPEALENRKNMGLSKHRLGTSCEF